MGTLTERKDEDSFVANSGQNASITAGAGFRVLDSAQRMALKKESTLSLIQRIVVESCLVALSVFHERSLFYHNGKWVRLAEFVLAMKEGKGREAKRTNRPHLYREAIYDEVYDLTLAKFSNFPSPKTSSTKFGRAPQNNNRFTEKVDCRFYFKQLLEELDEELNEKQITAEIEIEEMVSKIATRFVVRHFYMSLKECRRRHKNSIKYAWRVKSRTWYLYYPSYLTPKQFLDWLEANVTEFDPGTFNEKDRIQALIDQNFPLGNKVQREDTDLVDQRSIQGDHYVEYREGEQFVNKLSIRIAQEKSGNFKTLRPAIRDLGQTAVYDLVKRVFSDLADEKYDLGKVARDFKLSKSSLCRFAGTNWFRNLGKEIKIPDLWANTAHVLASELVFMEAVENAGFVGALDMVLKVVKPKEGLNDD